MLSLPALLRFMLAVPLFLQITPTSVFQETAWRVQVAVLAPVNTYVFIVVVTPANVKDVPESVTVVSGFMSEVKAIVPVVLGKVNVLSEVAIDSKSRYAYLRVESPEWNLNFHTVQLQCLAPQKNDIFHQLPFPACAAQPL